MCVAMVIVTMVSPTHSVVDDANQNLLEAMKCQCLIGPQIY